MYEQLKKEFLVSLKQLRYVKNLFSEDNDLSLSEFLALSHIGHFHTIKEEVSASDLYKCMEISRPAVSQALNLLEDKGYIKRSISASDRRSVNINTTEKGDKILKKRIKEMDKFLDAIIERVTPERFKEFIDITNDFRSISNEIIIKERRE